MSYRYPQTIRSTVLNYKDAYDSPIPTTCNCSSSTFLDSHHQHVITGDLNFIKDDKLRNLLKKGLNYRDQQAPSTRKAYIAVQEAVKEYCKKMSNRFKMPIETFSHWKVKVLEKVHEQLDLFENYDYNSVLSDSNVKLELQELHKNYVLVPTDKAANNVTIICKLYYISLINKELGSNNFELVENITPEEIIKNHENFLLKHRIKLLDTNRQLPYLYITPKQHKTPIGFRYITSGASCTLQQLSKLIGVTLKSMLHSAKNRSLYDNKFFQRNDYYVIDSNEPIINFINMNNFRRSPKSINTYDFSTVYTSIPHTQLKENMKKFF